MIEFDPLHYPYASTRNVVYAKNGMCCAGNPSAASAGLQTLLKGGNAIDAAVAMALSQPVVERPRVRMFRDCLVQGKDVWDQRVRPGSQSGVD